MECSNILNIDHTANSVSYCRHRRRKPIYRQQDEKTKTMIRLSEIFIINYYY